MTSEPSAGVAVLGTGDIAREHVRAFRRAGAALTWVFGTDAGRAADLAAGSAGMRPSTSLQDPLMDEATVGVVVCGRSATHRDRTIAALEAGKHVLVEKPPAGSLADFDRMVAAAHTAQRSLFVGQTVRFQPAVAAMAARVEAGAIGIPRVLHMSWYIGHVWPGAWRSWQLDPETSGGHIAHNGMHPLDLAIWLLRGTPVRVFARGWCTHAAQMPTPDSFHLTVEFDNGALALIEVSYALARRGDVLRRTVLIGTDGSLRHHTDDDDIPSGTEPADRASVADALVHEARHAMDVFAGRTEPIITLAQSRAALAAALAGQRSLDLGRPIEIAEVEKDV
ncbi:hypothetical protein ASD65_10420 [Microbacterium sp. Root61]|uniref:Gfo/Idh/MocA family protein n=1 Tax=Microbacterium sp. Root61 TaxID=1736570 RepID=UPI0006F43DD1|nr:Gfo/Idh/MocA family oxidoreductase [Microbacterium sp. Root61]KRA24791.1 hypothetical protein ASD65_10420 [Microbacterium sp. Root61]